MSRCMAEFGYKRAGVANSTNSAAVYGTVMHHSLLVLERQMALGDSEALALNKAIETFIYYWLPANVSGLTDPVPGGGATGTCEACSQMRCWRVGWYWSHELVTAGTPI